MTWSKLASFGFRILTLRNALGSPYPNSLKVFERQIENAPRPVNNFDIGVNQFPLTT
jgi:hypothetical protein